MTAARRRPVLYVIACGGRPAADLPAFITWAQDQGWDPCVITTPAGTQFVDADRLAEPDRPPRPRRLQAARGPGRPAVPA